MSKIYIVNTPPGLAEEHIRKAWVGIVIPLASEEEVDKAARQSGTPRESVVGYVVRGTDAVRALIDAGKNEAASYWSRPVSPAYLEFARECCKKED